MTWTLDYNQHRVEVVNAAELRQQLLDLHRSASQEPSVVTITAPDGSCLAIGVGRSRGILNYIAPGGWPAQHALGSDIEGFVEFKLAGQVSEVPARCTIPIEECVDTAVEFFSSQTLNDRIRWEND